MKIIQLNNNDLKTKKFLEKVAAEKEPKLAALDIFLKGLKSKKA